MSRKKKRRSTRARWILGISCMLVSAMAFAAVIFFSQAGLEEKPVEKDNNTKAKNEESQEETKENQKEIQSVLEKMTLEEKVAQLFVITPDALTGVEGTYRVGDVTKAAYEERPVGGLIMMGGNLKSPDQIKEWNRAIEELSKEKTGAVPFLSVDEEGGTVARIAGNEAFGIENVGNMEDIGASEDGRNAYDAGKTIGSYLKELGFNMNYAPVADLWTNQENTMMKERSFGSEPKLVAEMVEQEIKGLHSEGIYTVTKHFPGHGDTSGDSHDGTVYSECTEKQLKNRELIPFESAIEAGTECVMVGHLSLPNIVDDKIPASLSEKVVTEMLRKDLKFDGLVFTDAMNMKAITESYSSEEAAVLAVRAGADVILMPEDFEEAYEGILNAVNSGDISEKRINESVERILEVKLGLKEK